LDKGNSLWIVSRRGISKLDKITGIVFDGGNKD